MNADVLMLDEPTGHLDVDNIKWLEDWLESFPGSIICTSHFSPFLDKMCTHIIDFQETFAICVETWNCIASLLHSFSIFQLPLIASMSIVVEARPWWTLRSLEGQKVEDLQGREGHLLDSVRGEVPWEEGVARGYSIVFLRVLSVWLGGSWIKWTYTITILL